MRLITSALLVLLAEPAAHAQKTPAEFLQAIAQYTRAIEANPKDADALLARALAYEAVGRDVAALSDLSALIKVSPKSSAAFERRATIYFRLGDVARAGSDYSAAAFLDPRNAAALYGVGVTRRMDRFSPAGSADDHIAAALSIQPDIAERMDERGVK